MPGSKIMVLEGLGEAVAPSREACAIYLKSGFKKAARATGRGIWKGTKYIAKGAGQLTGKGIHHLTKQIAKSTERYAGLGALGKLTEQQVRLAKAAKVCRGRAGRGGVASFRSCMRQRLKKK